MPATGGNATTGGSPQAVAELQRVTDVALSHLGLDDLLTELLDRIREILHADTAAILLMDESAGLLRARAAKGIEEEVEQGVQIPLGRGFAGRIAAERRAVVIDDIDHADILNPILREKGIRSLLGVPLLVEGRVLGVLHVGTLTPRRFTEHDRDLLQLAADRAALAIEHGQLYERERNARLRAERAQADMHAVQRVTDAGLAYLPLDELLEELLVRTREILVADTAAILLLDEEADVLRARAAKGIEEEVEQGVRIPVGRGFAGRIAAERTAVVIDDVDHADILNPILREKGIRSLLGVPLLVEGRVLGVLHVGTLTPRRFTEHDRDLLQLAADRAALAIEHAQLYEERRLTTALQQALLPQQLVSIPGLAVAARYLPAAQGSSLGGDWYDVFAVTGRPRRHRRGRRRRPRAARRGAHGPAAHRPAGLRVRGPRAGGGRRAAESHARAAPAGDDDDRPLPRARSRGGAHPHRQRRPPAAARHRPRRARALPAGVRRRRARRVARVALPRARRRAAGGLDDRAVHRRRRRAARRAARRRPRAPARASPSAAIPTSRRCATRSSRSSFAAARPTTSPCSRRGSSRSATA